MKVKNPMDIFFNLGNKVTRNDPGRMADFNYAMMWIMFIAFFSILLTNVFTFIKLVSTDLWLALRALAWAFVMLAILWFQYNALKQQREIRKNIKLTYSKLKESKPEEKKELVENSVEEMLDEFKK